MKATRNILLIEPKQSDREVLPVLLEKIGLHSYVAGCLNDAFFILKGKKRWHIDTVILSSETLDKKQLDFIQWIKQKHPEIKILAMSCRTSDKEVCQARNILYLRKPITNCSVIADILMKTH